MTELQYSAIKALATSPEAYKAFKLSVRNRKGLDQYMNRVWPYYVKKTRESLPVYGAKKMLERKFNAIKKHLVSGSFDSQKLHINFNLNEIKSIIMMDTNSSKTEVRGFQVETYRSIKHVMTPSLLRLADLDVDVSSISSGKTIITSKASWREIENERYFVIMAIRKVMIEIIRTDISISGKELPVNPKKADIIKKLKNAPKDYFIRISIDPGNFLERLEADYLGKSFIVNILIKSIMDIEAKYALKHFKTAKYKKLVAKASQNVGIEIEYSGSYVNAHEKMKEMGAVSYECGYDGSFGDVKRNLKENRSRLRELRLRMNGIYSIKALDSLLKKMRDLECGHSYGSSIHYHIDRRDILKQEGKRVLDEAPRLDRVMLKAHIQRWTTSDKILVAVGRIFESKSLEETHSYILNKIKYSDEFSTLEWRFGSRTLSYSKMILQILTAIHLTNSTRYSNKKFNEEYIVMLAKIAEELY